jgi:hypothetical protein
MQLHRIPTGSALPLTLALQGAALTLVGFFALSPPPGDSARIGVGDLPQPNASAMGELQIPRDLVRERLPVPKVPDSAELDEPETAPRPDPEMPKAPIASGDRLAALRVTSVALAGLIPMDSPTPIPGPPDVLGLNDIGGSSGRSWLGGDRRTSRGSGGFLGPSDAGDDGSGWGGTGIGGWGRGRGGHGDNCVPGRRGLIGRPRSPGGTTARPPHGVTGSGGQGGQPTRGDRPARGGPKR